MTGGPLIEPEELAAAVGSASAPLLLDATGAAPGSPAAPA
jgi:hypothetical protein